MDLPFEEQTLKHWEQLVNRNGHGTFLLTQAALPHLAPQGSRIINISSISAKEGMTMPTSLSGSKAMVGSFTKVWVKESPPKYNCTVNCVSPGPMRTEAFDTAGMDFWKVISPLIESTPVANRDKRDSLRRVDAMRSTCNMAEWGQLSCEWRFGCLILEERLE